MTRAEMRAYAERQQRENPPPRLSPEMVRDLRRLFGPAVATLAQRASPRRAA